MGNNTQFAPKRFDELERPNLANFAGAVGVGNRLAPLSVSRIIWALPEPESRRKPR